MRLILFKLFFYFLFHTIFGQEAQKPGASSQKSSSKVKEASSVATSRIGVTKFQIEGKVTMPKSDPKVPKDWQANTRILVNYGVHVGFVQ